MTNLNAPEKETTFEHRRIPTKVRFESGEHVFIGDTATLRFSEGAVSARQKPLKLYDTGATSLLHNERRLTFGQVLALGGDFFGDPLQPISDAPNTKNKFSQVIGGFYAINNYDPNQVAQILSIMSVEIQALDKAKREGHEPSEVYDKLGDDLSYRWNVATGGKFGLDPNGRYLALAAVNWDHFGHDAVKAYQAGHQLAIDWAINIHGKTDFDDRLEEIYAVDAFACHFLTDVFSARHMRTPRRQLSAQVGGVGGSTIGSLLARAMHDEDSKNGLHVENANGDKWVAYGDKRYLDRENYQNLHLVDRAVQASVDDIWQAASTGAAPKEFGALQLVPNLTKLENPRDHDNQSPLFCLVNGKVYRRNDVANGNDYSWTYDWWGATTLALLKAKGKV